MKNNKGQALVEFVLVLPIFILILISMVDFANIILKKYELENNLELVYQMYKENKTNELNNYIEENDMEVSYSHDNSYLTITLSKDINIISPALIPIFGDTYSINTDGVYYE